MRVKSISILLGMCLLITRVTHAADGDLDPAFGGGTGFITSLAVEDVLTGAIQQDGKIVVLGQYAFLTNQNIIARFTSDGTLDATFNGVGYVLTNDFLYDVLLQPDGKIISAGTTGLSSILARYNSDGSVDTTFGSGGITTGPGIIHYAAMLEPDGKIVVAGATSASELQVVRYTADGVLEATFDAIAGIMRANDIKEQADGKIVVAGNNNTPNPIIVRFNNDGTLDTTFDPITFGALRYITALALQTNGQIVAGGSATTGGPYTFMAARYTTAGQLDGTYGSGGVVTAPDATAIWYGAAMQPGNLFMFGGPDDSYSNFVVARYTDSGALDAGFGSGLGYVTGPAGGWIGDLIPQSNGYTVAVGVNAAFSQMILARYINSPTLTQTAVTFPVANAFVAPGTVTLSGTAQNPSTVYVYVDGVFVSGVVTDPAGTNTWSLDVPITTLGSHTVQAISIYKNHKLSTASEIISFTIGESPTPASGIDFTGVVRQNIFLNKTEYVILASWPTDADAVSYNIYKNGVLIRNILNSRATMCVQLLKKCKDNASDFQIAAVDAQGVVGDRSTLVIK